MARRSVVLGMVGFFVVAGSALADDGRIAGRVVRESGEVAANAEVVLLPPPPKGQDAYYGRLPLKATRADDRGDFAFEGLAPGRYRVWANVDDETSRMASSRGEVRVIAEGAPPPAPLELRTTKAAMLAVAVTAAGTGGPIAGATVALGWTDLPADSTTKADGRAIVGPLPKGRWHVEVRADGFALETRWIELERGRTAELAFALEPGREVAGVVRDPEGRPIAGAGLSFRRDGQGDQLEYVTTDAEGRFRRKHLPRDADMEVSISKADFLNVERKVGPNDGATLDVVLTPRPHGGSIVGRVADGQGRPIAGVTVKNPGRSSNLVREAKGDETGRFVLDDLYEGIRGKEIVVRAPGFVGKKQTVEPGPADQPAEVAITLEPGHKIRGRVVDASGKPIPGVRVATDREIIWGTGDQAETDAEGRFAFDTLAANTPFSFGKAGFSEIEGRPLPLDGDETVVVTMSPPGVLVGRAVDAATDRPIPGFNVRITFSPTRKPDEPNSGIVSTLVDPGTDFADADGRFRIGDLVAGMPFQVTLSTPGYEPTTLDRMIARPADAPEPTTFRLEKLDPADLRAYRGRVTAADGRPVVGAQVRLIAARDRPQEANQRANYPFNWSMVRSGQVGQHANARRFLSAATDAEGRFAFADVPRSLEVELAWWGVGIVPGRRDHLEFEPEGEPIAIRLPAPAKIVGTIDRAKFRDVVQIQISFQGVDGQDGFNFDALELKPDQAEFAFDGLPPGTYRILLVNGRGEGRVALAGEPTTHVVAEGETVRVAFGKE